MAIISSRHKLIMSIRSLPEVGFFSACSSVVHVLDTVVVGIENEYHTNATAYPNPTKNFIYLTQENKSSEAVTVLNVEGKKVASLKLINSTIDISSLPPSTYIFIIGDTSKKVKPFRIVKE